MSEDRRDQLDLVVKATIPVAALLMGIATWNFNAALDDIRENATKIHRLEMFEAEVRGNRFTQSDAARMQQLFMDTLNALSRQQAVTQQVMTQLQDDVTELCKQQTSRWDDATQPK